MVATSLYSSSQDTVHSRKTTAMQNKWVKRQEKIRKISKEYKWIAQSAKRPAVCKRLSILSKPRIQHVISSYIPPPFWKLLRNAVKFLTTQPIFLTTFALNVSYLTFKWRAVKGIVSTLFIQLAFLVKGLKSTSTLSQDWKECHIWYSKLFIPNSELGLGSSDEYTAVLKSIPKR